MTVAQLRQHARAIGLSSVTRLNRRASLIAAIRSMQQRYPHRYPPTPPVTGHAVDRPAGHVPEPDTRPARPSHPHKQPVEENQRCQ
jgi:hypothetical protein